MGDLLELLEKIFEGAIPHYLLWILLGLVVIVTLLRSIPFFHKEIIPIFYNEEKRRRRYRRQRFAEHIEHKLRELNSKEEWADYRFTELEAEVEAEGKRRSRLLPFLTRRDPLRRERSLTKALENSTERLILLEGVPGSGKSVALRHVALIMAQSAMRFRSLDSRIPLYVNLKYLKRRTISGDSENVDAEFIRRFVLENLNKTNDRDVSAFLDDEFQTGLNNGSWLFLFDSFDEIPEILSSTDADSIIATYAQAISDFLHGMNKCRGIVASREYRGPKYLSWSRFRIMPLSVNQRQKLIERAGLSRDEESIALGGVFSGTHGLDPLAENPMFLGLLCEYVRTNHKYPEHNFSVYEAFIASRILRDEERLQQRYGLPPIAVKNGAEVIAFCMMSDSGLGLSATSNELATSLTKHDFVLEADAYQLLEALCFIKLAKVEDSATPGTQPTFSFTHRRLQEYLATMVLLREPNRVQPIDGVWRESAVVLLQQTEDPAQLEPLLQAGVAVMTFMLKQFPDRDESSPEVERPIVKKEDWLPEPFSWPPKLLHVMELLQDGLIGRLEIVPNMLRDMYAYVVATVWDQKQWLISDLRSVLAVAGLLPQELLGEVLYLGLIHRSRRIRDIAYRQSAMLKVLEPHHVTLIQASLVESAEEGRLQREYRAITAFLLRLDHSVYFLAILRFLRAIPYLSLVLGTVVVGSIWPTLLRDSSWAFRIGVSLILLFPFILGLTQLIGTRRGRILIVIAIVIGSILLLVLGFRVEQRLPGTGLVYSYVLFIAYFYALIWRLLARGLAYSGILIQPQYWPAALMVPAVSLVWRLPRTVSSFVRTILAHWRWKIALYYLFLVIISLLLGLGVVIAEQRYTFVNRIMLVVVSLSPLIMLWQATTEFRPHFRDRRFLKEATNSTHKTEAHDFLDGLKALASFETRIKYLQLARERQLLADSPDTISTLKLLASRLQRDLLVDKETVGKSGLFDRKSPYGLAALFNWEFLDNLHLLLEELEQSQS